VVNVGWFYGSDEAIYMLASREIANGHVMYRDFSLGSYPLAFCVLGLFYRVLGCTLLVATSVSVAFAALTLFMYYFLLRHSNKPPVALLSVAFLSYIPSFFILSRHFMLEVPMTMFIMASILLMRRGDATWAGVMMGLALVTKPTSLPFLVAMLVVLTAGRSSSTGALRKFLVGSVASIVSVLTPFLILCPGAYFDSLKVNAVRWGFPDLLQSYFLEDYRTVLTAIALVSLILFAVFPKRMKTDRVDAFFGISFILSLVLFQFYNFSSQFAYPLSIPLAYLATRLGVETYRALRKIDTMPIQGFDTRIVVIMVLLFLVVSSNGLIISYRVIYEAAAQDYLEVFPEEQRARYPEDERARYVWLFLASKVRTMTSPSDRILTHPMIAFLAERELFTSADTSDKVQVTDVWGYSIRFDIQNYSDQPGGLEYARRFVGIYNLDSAVSLTIRTVQSRQARLIVGTDRYIIWPKVREVLVQYYSQVLEYEGWEFWALNQGP